MKTAISIPDHTFAEADRRARELGLNRSQFVTRAIERYLNELAEGDDLTDRINAALDAAGPEDPDDIAVRKAATRAAFARLDAEDGGWA
ncbi:ribbon-helix-helix domain-containing protein [Blastococcus sp. PRF04-17]|uniref:ribbon-helix-helix domain-containing protein n=1 Tax=Blastococcus sp. PRF04-17 TaxID=2933797 RepID=UPI001FF46106|nr:ribbon-helix-helix domain-containing protein [Blastococcus sp. PRF04-17]UOY00230.1 ribbon-helix-helix domain-containing protein [Blastococcus sp. PRF04-17]